MVFGGEDGIGAVELMDVVGAVVGREGDAGEDEFGSGGLEGGEDVFEIGAGALDGEASKAVVSAELDDDDGGVEGEDGGEAFDAVLGGVAADAFVDDAVVEAAGVEVALEVVGVALAGVGAVACGEGVAEAGDDGTGVGWGHGRGGRGRGWLGSFDGGVVIR